MVKGHDGSMFYTLRGLSIRILPSYHPELSVCIVSRTRTFKAIVYQSHKYQPALTVWVFHQVVPSLVLKTLGVMHRVHRAFEAFDDSDQDLAQFIELRIFPRCDQFLVSWSCNIEPELA
jgi:prophage antirepressor-like protein